MINSKKEYFNMEDLDFGKVTESEIIPEPVQSANAFFHFVKHLKYLENFLLHKKLPIWYVKEDFRYLNLPNNIESIFIPMKCFCDINLHKLQSHMEYYGNYGIAFSKDWGINQTFQPVHYVNEKSLLTKQYISSFKAGFNDSDSINDEIKNYLATDIMYMKPIIGYQKDVNNIEQKKYFLDESEWRYIFDVSNIPECKPFYIGNNSNDMTNFNLALADENQGLKFDYKDIKYIIINSEDEFLELVSKLKGIDLKENEMNLLISKILIWEQSKGDF